MLEVSPNHFNHVQANGTPVVYMHEHQEPSIYSPKAPDADKYSVNSNWDNCEVDKHNHFELNTSETNRETLNDAPVRRRILDIKPTPLSVSTPTSEGSSCADIPSDYLQKKAKRISRIYHDHSNDPFEDLKVEPLLLEYLVRHGALTQEASTLISNAEKHDQKSLLLSELGLSSDSTLRYNDPGTPPSTSLTTGFALLLNALRHTGHHTLASHLDCGRRIRPSPHYQSSELLEHGPLSSIQRRRGQLSLRIRLDAIKVDPATYDRLIQTPTPDCASDAHASPTKVSDRSVDSGPARTTRQKSFTPMLPSFVEYLADDQSSVCGSPQGTKQTTQLLTPQAPFWIDLNEPPTAEAEVPLSQPSAGEELPPVPAPPEKSPGCFHKFFCLFRPFRKRKSRKRKLKVVSEPEAPVLLHTHDENDVGLIRSGLPVLPVDGAGDGPPPASRIDRLAAAKLALLDNKSLEFCQAVADSSLAFYDAVVKYFEQSSGVLVLDCAVDSESSSGTAEQTSVSSGSTLRVTVVATRTDLVTRLTDACQPSPPALSGQPETRSNLTAKPVLLCGCRMSTDLQKVLTESGIRTVLRVQDFRLSVSLDPDEVTKALEELADLIE